METHVVVVALTSYKDPADKERYLFIYFVFLIVVLMITGVFYILCYCFLCFFMI